LLLLVVPLSGEPLPQLFQDLAGIPEEGLDVGPDDLLDIPAVDAFGRALLTCETVQPSGELPSVAAVVVVRLAGRSAHSRKRQPAQARFDETAK
jgi:hypothetical protein